MRHIKASACLGAEVLDSPTAKRRRFEDDIADYDVDDGDTYIFADAHDACVDNGEAFIDNVRDDDDDDGKERANFVRLNDVDTVSAADDYNELDGNIFEDSSASSSEGDDRNSAVDDGAVVFANDDDDSATRNPPSLSAAQQRELEKVAVTQDVHMLVAEFADKVRAKRAE